MTQRKRKSFIHEGADEDAAVFGARGARSGAQDGKVDGGVTNVSRQARGIAGDVGRTHRVTVIFDDATFKALKRYVIDSDDVDSMSELIRAQIAGLVAGPRP